MMDLIKTVQPRLEVARFMELDENWRTSRFLNQLSVIPFGRIYFPVEGEGYVHFENKKLHLRPGFIYLIPPFAATEVYCPKHLVKYWVHFNAFVLDSELDLFNIGLTAYELPVADPERTISLFQTMIRSYELPAKFRKTPLPAIRQLECHAALTMLLIPFYESMINAEAANSKINERFFKLLYHVETHLSGPLNLKKLAAEVHLNPTYLSNLFAEKMGLPLIRYCNNRRIARAINLLRNTDYSIEDIALRQGAESTAAFSRLFKRHTGLSLRAYRKTLASEQS